MLYLYHKEASASTLTLTGDSHRYIFKVRRHKSGEILHLRNLEDGYLYTYKIVFIDKNSACLSLKRQEIFEVKASRTLHIGWCIIDPKNIEKVLPSLNEMGVEKITFIYCKRSQKSFKPDFERFKKILLNSSQQCGRSVMMKLEMVESLEVFLKTYPKSYLLNFSEHTFNTEVESILTIVVGCEGGFSEEELTYFYPNKIIGFKTPLVLKSESAICAIAAKLIV
ncbi:MAG: 16S rRNA (uracil(1498)-N(3))-methyltransferase [Sulfurovum sp.]|nr:16S rRNA (uracil(1498)-N(3))-methyltransferase [Sulfurovum sp.]